MNIFYQGGVILILLKTTMVVLGLLSICILGTGCALAEEEVLSNPLVTMDLGELGIMEIELYPEIAPNTVNNFIYLVQKGFYDGLTFHRVIPGFMIQGGDPTGTGSGGCGYSIAGEFKSNGFKNDLSHERGVISMARTNDPNSAGPQFFIMVEKAPHLDGNYAAFGRVIKGIEVADKIVNAPRNRSDRPNEEQIIVKMTVNTFGVDYPEPIKYGKE